MKHKQDNKIRSCRQCGQEFTLTSIELSGYRMKELPTPEDCRACRNRARSEENYYSSSPAILRRAENH